MHGQARPKSLGVLDSYLLHSLGPPGHPSRWSWAQPLRAAQAGAFDWLLADLARFGVVSVETEPDSGVSCVYTIETSSRGRLVCYLATAAPWAAVLAYCAAPRESEAWIFDHLLSGPATWPQEGDLARLLAELGFHLATEMELVAESPYHYLGRALTYWELLFESEIAFPSAGP